MMAVLRYDDDVSVSCDHDSYLGVKVFVLRLHITPVHQLSAPRRSLPESKETSDASNTDNLLQKITECIQRPAGDVLTLAFPK